MRSPEATGAQGACAANGGEGIGAIGVIAATERWLAIAVVGLGLCPFAAPVVAQGRVRFAVSPASDSAALLRELGVEAKRLSEVDAAEIETTLLIHPQVLTEFDDYNRFLGRADRQLSRQGLRGVLQIASFHPRYRFAASAADDMANFTNRSPFPMLQLLRERSVDCALANFPDARGIYRRNVARLRRLGPDGWAALWSADGRGVPGNAP